MGRAQRLIRTGADPILKTPCVPVAPGENLSELFADMEFVCKRLKGVGLAAPQVGSNKQVIYLLTNLSVSVRGVFMLNPELISVSAETNVQDEGCLSYPGIFKAIARPNSVRIRYETPTRERKERELHGYAARVFCHEFDHLQGICKVGDSSYPPAVAA